MYISNPINYTYIEGVATTALAGANAVAAAATAVANTATTLAAAIATRILRLKVFSQSFQIELIQNSAMTTLH